MTETWDQMTARHKKERQELREKIGAQPTRRNRYSPARSERIRRAVLVAISKGRLMTTGDVALAAGTTKLRAAAFLSELAKREEVEVVRLQDKVTAWRLIQ